jgi:hypothetical protein
VQALNSSPSTIKTKRESERERETSNSVIALLCLRHKLTPCFGPQLKALKAFYHLTPTCTVIAAALLCSPQINSFKHSDTPTFYLTVMYTVSLKESPDTRACLPPQPPLHSPRFCTRVKVTCNSHAHCQAFLRPHHQTCSNAAIVPINR